MIPENADSIESARFTRISNEGTTDSRESMVKIDDS